MAEYSNSQLNGSAIGRERDPPIYPHLSYHLSYHSSANARIYRRAGGHRKKEERRCANSGSRRGVSIEVDVGLNKSGTVKEGATPNILLKGTSVVVGCLYPSIPGITFHLLQTICFPLEFPQHILLHLHHLAFIRSTDCRIGK